MTRTLRDLTGALVGLLSLVLLACAMAGCGQSTERAPVASGVEIGVVGSYHLRKFCDGTTAVYTYGDGVAAVRGGC
ncbi:MAG: hypothetical protein FJ253_12195 [Phycisphaerae bacterium]|nr:hypothetical protein [Phycisphaerae bacterium]